MGSKPKGWRPAREGSAGDCDCAACQNVHQFGRPDVVVDTLLNMIDYEKMLDITPDDQGYEAACWASAHSVLHRVIQLMVRSMPEVYRETALYTLAQLIESEARRVVDARPPTGKVTPQPES